MEILSEEIEKYISKHSTKEDDVLYELYRETYLTTTHPRMLSGHTQGVYLQMMAQIANARRILEIGTFTGYSAICLARGMQEDGILHTIEVKEELFDIAQKYIKRVGLQDKIIQHTGNALDVIPKINEEFDLVFMDADKRNYPSYYQLIIDKLSSGGLLIADNVLWGGKVVGKLADNDKDTRGVIAFNKMVQEDERVSNVMLPLRDGLMLVRKK